jgi:uncharacterized protein (DUF1800 family)
MKAVISAILLDPEARHWPHTSAIEHGMLRESFLRRVHLARAFEAANLAFDYPIADPGAPITFAQRPLSSPTVFNFFLPDYQPQGVIAEAGLVAPEFQIITAVTAITSSNDLQTQIENAMNSASDPRLEVRLDLSPAVAIADDARALLDRLDLLLMYGNMSGAMREVLLEALEQLADPRERVELAVHLISISPEYCVLK